MRKLVKYSGKTLESYDIEGTPCADMKGIIELAVSGSWSDYVQVLNSSDDLVYDLDVKCIDGVWLVPVPNISKWLYTFSLRNVTGNLYDRLRVFRRDVENSFRVAWALPVVDLVSRVYEAPYAESSGFTISDLSNIFLSFGVPDEELEGCAAEGEAFGPLHYIEYIAGGTYCGSRGSMLCDQIQYIEDMPLGDLIFEHINYILQHSLVPPTDYLDDYLDDINTLISFEATRFVGEL